MTSGLNPKFVRMMAPVLCLLPPLRIDDILMIHHDGIKALREIDHFFKTKPNSIGDPEFYLGAKLQPITLPNGVIAWGMSASKYDQAAVAIVKAYHSKIFRRGSGEAH
jgi:hypothetical protein